MGQYSGSTKDRQGTVLSTSEKKKQLIHLESILHPNIFYLTRETCKLCRAQSCSYMFSCFMHDNHAKPYGNDKKYGSDSTNMTACSCVCIQFRGLMEMITANA